MACVDNIGVIAFPVTSLIKLLPREMYVVLNESVTAGAALIALRSLDVRVSVTVNELPLDAVPPDSVTESIDEAPAPWRIRFTGFNVVGSTGSENDKTMFPAFKLKLNETRDGDTESCTKLDAWIPLPSTTDAMLFPYVSLTIALPNVIHVLDSAVANVCAILIAFKSAVLKVKVTTGDRVDVDEPPVN